MVLEVVARALTKHALNVHCGHDDVYGGARHGMDHSVRQRRAAKPLTRHSFCGAYGTEPDARHELPDGFLTSHLERTFYKHESD